MTARLSPRRSRCMHCARDIYQLTDGRWVDSDVMDVCMQTTGSTLGAPGVVIHHTPLPTI